MPFDPRPEFNWRLRTRTLALGGRTLLMGIVNVTPDSFSDGARFKDSAAAIECALQMLDDGADILDLGGESTRPGATPVAPEEEQARVLPVLRGILAARPDAVLSIDTYHAATARIAVEAGAEIVNDVSGHLWDPAMSAECAALHCGAILMHTRGKPQDWRAQIPLAADEVVPLVQSELRQRTAAALAAGVARESIVIDPGFGFGKLQRENDPLLAHFADLHCLGYPVLVGLSRKSFLKPAATTSPQCAALDPSLPTTVANTIAVLAGAHILRVHDIPQASEAAFLADRILNVAAIDTASDSLVALN
jgi:dihydropteroate synthase